MLAEIITIGDEILYGQITDTNTQWLSATLDKIGIKTIRKSSVGDNKDEILMILGEAESRADLILITGGLGPTKDDLTKGCLATYFDCKLSLDEKALTEVTAFFEKKGRKLTPTNYEQAVLPDTCEAISNKYGTAPGMWFKKGGKIFVSMPGVPFEMKQMMQDYVIPALQKDLPASAIYHKIIRTVGIGESFLADTIRSWEESLPAHIKLAYLPGLGQVRLRLTATGENMDMLEAAVAAEIEKLQLLAGSYIYGFDHESLEAAVGLLLLQKRKTLALAESCSGGYIAHAITRIPGSSRYFQGGVVPYQNDIKVDLLGVKPETLDHFGAVSEETVKEMANRVREKYRADIGAASSGIAGPGGGTAEKPVGTIWVACADGQQTITRKLFFAKDRLMNIQLTAVAVLDLIRKSLLKND